MLRVRKLLLFIKSVRTDPVYRDIVKHSLRCVAPSPLIVLGSIVRCRCYAPFNAFPVYYSINGVSPNGLYMQQQFSIHYKKICTNVSK